MGLTDPVSVEALVKRLREHHGPSANPKWCCGGHPHGVRVADCEVLAAAEALETKNEKCAHVDDVLMLEREARQQAEADLRSTMGEKWVEDHDALRFQVEQAEALAKQREEERDFAVKQMQAEIEVRGLMAEQMRALRDALRRLVERHDFEHHRGIPLGCGHDEANAARSLLNAEKSEDTPACGKCGEPEASIRHQSTTFAAARAVRAHAFQPAPENAPQEERS